ncbi:2880_t:CDS:2 [Funneliformis mosseae]|uniref:2880_t:CDS:1 n=1 Tax=Funneliformis mosseae TaxID=27381 RepID=A0A9N9BFY7_FUNMO|nr:2880_t:CDS:2 [Funneliformis mosseae]
MKDETKGDPIGKSVCLKPKMYSVLPAGYDSKTPETDADFKKELEEKEYRKSQGEKKWEKKHSIQKSKGDIELAQVKVIKTALRKGKKYDNLAKNYGDYLKKLRAEKNLNDYIKTVAVKMFPNEEAYT